MTVPIRNSSAGPSILGKRQRSEPSPKTVTWVEEEYLVEVIEVPTRQELDISEIWHEKKQLGLQPILERNDSQEIQELSDSMSDFPWLSEQKKKEYSYKRLKGTADILSEIRSRKIARTQACSNLSQLGTISD